MKTRYRKYTNVYMFYLNMIHLNKYKIGKAVWKRDYFYIKKHYKELKLSNDLLKMLLESQKK